MPVDPLDDATLRAALLPYRPDPAPFEAAVRTRLQTLEAERAADPLAGMSPWHRSAAASVPFPLIVGGPVSGPMAKLVATTGSTPLVSFLTFPAVSLFLLLGASIFSLAGMNAILRRGEPTPPDDAAQADAVRLWWTRHRWAAGLIYGASLSLMFVGATWIVFVGYIFSFGALLYGLASMGRLGIGNRQLVGRSCAFGLFMLWQVASVLTLRDQDLHFIDQNLIPAVFLLGVGLIATLSLIGTTLETSQRWRIVVLSIMPPLFALIMAPVLTLYLAPTLQPITTPEIKSYVESFDTAPDQMVSWRKWEIVARWAIETGFDPNLTRPRRLLNQTLAGPIDPFTLGSAIRVGLIPAARVASLPEYKQLRQQLLEPSPPGREPWPIYSLTQEDWVIRGSVLNGSLTRADRDQLEQRLHATMRYLIDHPSDAIAEALEITQLLAAIGRPVDPARYRTLIHGWLRRFHDTSGSPYQISGGFAKYLNLSSGSTETTEEAIELMEVYGIPDDLDINWVRSYVRQRGNRIGDQWIIAVARARLNDLPGVRSPTWIEILVAERTLIAALVLVGLCAIATLASPPVRRNSQESVD